MARNTTKISLPSADTQKKFVRGILLLIGVSLLIIFIFGDHGLVQLYKLKRERKDIQKHITALRQSRETLASEKNKLENDLEYIEKLAREKYRMAKKGEQVFKVFYHPRDEEKKGNQ